MGDGFDHAMDCMDAQRDLYQHMKENVWDDEHIPYVAPYRRPLECKHCGSEKVSWESTGGRWAMMNSYDNKRHICSKKQHEEPPF